MRVVAVGDRAFVAGFQLAGVEGVEAKSPRDALKTIRILMLEKDVGLIIVSDSVGKDIRNDISDLRIKQPVPLIYEVPSPSSKREKVDYRELIKRMLKIG